MRVRQVISASTKPANEDAAGHRGDGAWVIDGATPLRAAPLVDGVSPAAWLSRACSGFLLRTSWVGQSLPEILAAMIERVTDLGAAQGLTGSDFPSAAVSLVRCTGQHVEVCALGDCTVLVARPDGKPVEVTDPQFADEEVGLLARVRGQLRQGATPADAYAEIQPELKDRRLRRNSSNGLWVVGADPAAARHAAVAFTATPLGADVVLMTDGFSRCLWPFGLVSDTAEFMTRITAGGATGLLDELRTAEAADPDCAQTPRFGRHDDATMVWLQT
jgi:hypothetical protein